MIRRRWALIVLGVALLSVACAGRSARDTAPLTASEDVDATTAPTVAVAIAVNETPTSTADSIDPETDRTPTPGAESPSSNADETATPPPLATREGADYVLRLPREDAVPADWAMSPQPDFQRRAPQPGDTYPFACRDLPARSIGIATVGYRHLDGLPSVAIEYVIYASAADAEAALADMAATAETCGDFTLGATTAAFVPLDFPDLGDGRFAAALTTHGTESGDLLIHVVKVRQGHVVIGISHTTYAGEAPPDEALTRALVEQAMDNLRDAPQPTGPSAN